MGVPKGEAGGPGQQEAQNTRRVRLGASFWLWWAFPERRALSRACQSPAPEPQLLGNGTETQGNSHSFADPAQYF